MLKSLILWLLFIFFCYLACTAFDMGEMTIAGVMLGFAVIVGLPLVTKKKDRDRDAEPAGRRRR